MNTAEKNMRSDPLINQILDAVRAKKKLVEIEDASGKVIGSIKFSDALYKKYEAFLAACDRDDKIAESRAAAVEAEIKAVGDEVLPLDQEVMVNGGLVGRIVEVTKGYMDRPYYRIFLQNGEGTYGDPKDESNYGYFYARQLRNYGRGT